MTADPATAYRWLSLAGRYGVPDTPERQRALHALSTPQRSAIDRDIKQWRPITPVPPAIDRETHNLFDFLHTAGPSK